jgi:phosphoglycolate phosphatase
MVARFMQLYETAVSQTELYPGVPEALETLRASGHRLAICTNKPEAPTRAVLDHFALTPLFDALAFGDGPYPRKPDPAPVAHVLGALRQEVGLYIGDSETDAATAQAAGLPFLLFTEGYRKLTVEEIPHDAAFDAFKDLPALVAERI